MNTPVTSMAIGQKLLRPHPAFETDLSQGGWSAKLTGIWMGKFETTRKVNDKITIRPNVYSYESLRIGSFYTDAQNLGIANSHMAKNSEWGAMAYLSESKYGRNGVAVTKNSEMTTGQGDYKTNIAQSTTGNVYGIYDTIGGSYETVASYIPDSSLIMNYGSTFNNTKLATVYEMTDINSNTENYIANINKKFGDAIVETSTSGDSNTSWYSASSFFVNCNTGNKYQVFTRGGAYFHDNAGLFYFNNVNGNSGYQYNSFRVCASVQ